MSNRYAKKRTKGDKNQRRSGVDVVSLLCCRCSFLTCHLPFRILSIRCVCSPGHFHFTIHTHTHTTTPGGASWSHDVDWKRNHFHQQLQQERVSGILGADAAGGCGPPSPAALLPSPGAAEGAKEEGCHQSHHLTPTTSKETQGAMEKQTLDTNTHITSHH